MVCELQRLLPLTFFKPQRRLTRIDAGFGDDANLTGSCPGAIGFCAKGYFGKPAVVAYAHQLAPAAWLEVAPGRRWLAWSPVQVNLGWPDRAPSPCVWLTPTRYPALRCSLTTLCDLTLTTIADLYDDRGGVEVEIQTDKMGLLLARRRKRRFAAQEMLILLNDWAHNLLAWFRMQALIGSRFADYGPKRIIRDLLTIPGEAIIADDELVELRLKASHPYAAEMTHCLDRLWQVPTS